MVQVENTAYWVLIGWSNSPNRLRVRGALAKSPTTSRRCTPHDSQLSILRPKIAVFEAGVSPRSPRKPPTSHLTPVTNFSTAPGTVLVEMFLEPVHFNTILVLLERKKWHSSGSYRLSHLEYSDLSRTTNTSLINTSIQLSAPPV